MYDEKMEAVYRKYSQNASFEENSGKYILCNGRNKYADSIIRTFYIQKNYYDL